MDILELLRNTWPEGIPPSDYEKVSTLFLDEVEQVLRGWVDAEYVPLIMRQLRGGSGA